MKKTIRLTESDLVNLVKRVIMEQSQNKMSNNPAIMKYELGRQKKGYDTDEDIEERLIILYLMGKGNDRLTSIKILNGSNYESIQDEESENFMNWLVSIGLERGDVYVDTNNKSKVLNKVKELELKR